MASTAKVLSSLQASQVVPSVRSVPAPEPRSTRWGWLQLLRDSFGGALLLVAWIALWTRDLGGGRGSAVAGARHGAGERAGLLGGAHAVVGSRSGVGSGPGRGLWASHRRAMNARRRARPLALNPPQREAVTTVDGPVLVLAGAGSGKTRVIVHRIAYLMAKGVDPEGILAVTFTNKAAGEMRERVTAVAGAAGVDVFVSTFHSFGLWLLQQEHAAAGLPRRFAICDAGDQAALVKRCMREVKVDDRSFDAGRVLLHPVPREERGAQAHPGEGGRAGRRLPTSSPPSCSPGTSRRSGAALGGLRRPHRAPVKLLSKDAALRKRYARRFRHVLVGQARTRRRTASTPEAPRGDENVCAVGDDDQAIYGWRGA